MTFFDEAALRLKQELGLKTDKQVAAALGLSGVAWTGRKNRGNFPETELYALVAKQPDMAIDVAYVLTGERLPRHATQRVNHLARGAGKFKNEAIDELVGKVAKAAAAKNQVREDQYLRLKDLAEHCSDSEFDLLLKVAETFRWASVAKSKTDEP